MPGNQYALREIDPAEPIAWISMDARNGTAWNGATPPVAELSIAILFSRTMLCKDLAIDLNSP